MSGTMAPSSSSKPVNGALEPPKGPHPSTIELAKPYVFEQCIQRKMKELGSTEAREDTIRLQGVNWIDNVRKALQLPVRTYNTACVYYHKFRLEHPDNQFDFRDAAAAALFNACKIEDTLKKSKDILCAAYNLRASPADHVSSDDPLFENHAKTIVGLERLMLEASGFDFRNRYPQRMLLKFVKSCNLEKDTVGLLAYKVLLDLYRTFAPLKQTSQTMALASLELAIRLSGIDLASVTSDHAFDYIKWSTTREEIMETLADLLDLYTIHRTATVVGPTYAVENFLSVRITLNQESQANDYPRYTEWKESDDEEDPKSKTNSTKQSPKDTQTNGSTITPKSISPQSPNRNASAVGERGKEGTIRFMLDPERAYNEKSKVKEFYRVEEIEEDVEIEVFIDTVGSTGAETTAAFPTPASPPLDIPMSISSAKTSRPSTPSTVGPVRSVKNTQKIQKSRKRQKQNHTQSNDNPNLVPLGRGQPSKPPWFQDRDVTPSMKRYKDHPNPNLLSPRHDQGRMYDTHLSRERCDGSSHWRQASPSQLHHFQNQPHSDAHASRYESNRTNPPQRSFEDNLSSGDFGLYHNQARSPSTPSPHREHRGRARGYDYQQTNARASPPWRNSNQRVQGYSSRYDSRGSSPGNDQYVPYENGLRREGLQVRGGATSTTSTEPIDRTEDHNARGGSGNPGSGNNFNENNHGGMKTKRGGKNGRNKNSGGKNKGQSGGSYHGNVTIVGLKE